MLVDQTTDHISADGKTTEAGVGYQQGDALFIW
jgi:hypothetical protein